MFQGRPTTRHSANNTREPKEAYQELRAVRHGVDQSLSEFLKREHEQAKHLEGPGNTYVVEDYPLVDFVVFMVRWNISGVRSRQCRITILVIGWKATIVGSQDGCIAPPDMWKSIREFDEYTYLRL